MEHRYGQGAKFGADVIAPKGMVEAITFKNLWTFECFAPDGSVKWVENFENLFMNVGLDEVLDKFWKGSAYTAAHYVGILDAATSPIAFNAADVEDSHSGWTEVTAYAAGTRPTLTLGAVSGQSVDNSASKASYAINGTANVEGGFISTDNTKGTASPMGILMAAGSFTGGAKSVANGDTLNVTVTLTAASA